MASGLMGLGIDLCEIARIARAIQKPRFLARVYTEAERAAIERGGAQTAAGLFAAKEAVAKALGTGFRDFSMDSVEVAPDAYGKPLCTLHGGAHARMLALGGARVEVSITHDAGVAAAVAVLLG